MSSSALTAPAASAPTEWANTPPSEPGYYATRDGKHDSPTLINVVRGGPEGWFVPQGERERQYFAKQPHIAEYSVYPVITPGPDAWNWHRDGIPPKSVFVASHVEDAGMEADEASAVWERMRAAEESASAATC
jgi:hypothetical protein